MEYRGWWVLLVALESSDCHPPRSHPHPSQQDGSSMTAVDHYHVPIASPLTQPHLMLLVSTSSRRAQPARMRELLPSAAYTCSVGIGTPSRLFWSMPWLCSKLTRTVSGKGGIFRAIYLLMNPLRDPSECKFIYKRAVVKLAIVTSLI